MKPTRTAVPASLPRARAAREAVPPKDRAMIAVGVRFPPRDIDRINRRSAEDRRKPSDWIRAVVGARLDYEDAQAAAAEPPVAPTPPAPARRRDRRAKPDAAPAAPAA